LPAVTERLWRTRKGRGKARKPLPVQIHSTVERLRSDGESLKTGDIARSAWLKSLAGKGKRSCYRTG
jgi:hypothetical protein